MNPNLRTKAAARYLSERGKQTSPSWLEKARTRGPDDERDPGPNWTRDPATLTESGMRRGGICWYSVADLDAYLIRVLSARRPRAPKPQPVNFQKKAAVAA